MSTSSRIYEHDGKLYTSPCSVYRRGCDSLDADGSKSMICPALESIVFNVPIPVRMDFLLVERTVTQHDKPIRLRLRILPKVPSTSRPVLNLLPAQENVLLPSLRNRTTPILSMPLTSYSPRDDMLPTALGGTDQNLKGILRTAKARVFRVDSD